jgi:sugar phosphate permease
VASSHQIGAAAAALFAGMSRTASGSYHNSFVAAGLVAIFAAFLALMIGMKGRAFAPVAV